MQLVEEDSFSRGRPFTLPLPTLRWSIPWLGEEQMSLLLLHSFLEPVHLAKGLFFPDCFLVFHLRILSPASWGPCEGDVGSGRDINVCPLSLPFAGICLHATHASLSPFPFLFQTLVQLTLCEHLLCTYLLNKS